MTNLDSAIIWLSIAYALLGVLLLVICVFARIPWPVKAGLIALTSAFYMVSFLATRGLLGWSSTDPLPPKFELLGARTLSRTRSKATPAPFISGSRRSTITISRPARLAPIVSSMTPIWPRRQRPAVQASADGKPQGGRTADFGNGEGGVSEAAARETTPSTITTTGGGDPSTGGPIEPQFDHQENQTVNFSPLAPPRAPPKDAE